MSVIKLINFSLLLILISCVNEKIAIEYNVSSTNLRSINDEYLISNVTISQIDNNGNESSAKAYIDFSTPVKETFLNKVEDATYGGQSVTDILKGRDLLFKIGVVHINKDFVDTPYDLIVFKSSDLKGGTQVFYSLSSDKP